MERKATKIGQRTAAVEISGLIRCTEHLIGDEGIVDSFLPERRHGTVTGNETHLIAKRPKFLRDRVDELARIGSRQIGPATTSTR